MCDKSKFEISSNVIFSLLKSHLNEQELPNASPLNIKVFESILDIIYSLDGEQNFYYEYSNDLDEDDLNRDQDWEPAFEPLELNNTFFSYDYCNKVLDWKEKHPHCQFSTLQHRFRLVKNSSYLLRIKKYVEQMGTTREKFILIAKHTYEEFVRQRSIGNFFFY